MGTVLIDTYLCNGCATCVEICPAVFRLDDASGKAQLISPDPEINDAVFQAAAYCPVKCIEVREK